MLATWLAYGGTELWQTNCWTMPANFIFYYTCCSYRSNCCCCCSCYSCCWCCRPTLFVSCNNVIATVVVISAGHTVCHRETLKILPRASVGNNPALNNGAPRQGLIEGEKNGGRYRKMEGSCFHTERKEATCTRRMAFVQFLALTPMCRPFRCFAV